jgi:hypothetical protein
MSLEPGRRLRPYEIAAPLGAGGPASARADNDHREPWRGLADAKERRCR